MCKARFLNASVLDLADLGVTKKLAELDVVVMSETLEHLDRPIGVQVLGSIRQSSVNKLIITTPDNCMGPNEVPEHTALFNRDYIVDMLVDAEFSTDQWDISFDQADKYHLICVVERK
jgi:hypothetical protein